MNSQFEENERVKQKNCISARTGAKVYPPVIPLVSQSSEQNAQSTENEIHF